jgi:hypothetical protein
MSNSAITTQYATPAELTAILGDKWAICRDTPDNRERHGRCITRRQYLAATREALARRNINQTNGR